MNKRILILLPIVIPMIYCCCENRDIISPPPRWEEYKGTYQVDINPETDSSTMILQYIGWAFTDFRFFCFIDTVKSEKIICDFSGNYHIENDSIIFKDLRVSPGSCDSNLVARGKFEFTVIRGLFNLDTLRFYQRVENPDGTVEKTIRLVGSYY